MSATIQNKLTNLELDPPKGSWEKIVAELDDSASGMQFPSRLNELSIPPPASSWTAITSALDLELPANTVAAKLIATEIIPPANTWEKIEAELDAEMQSTTGRRVVPAWMRYAAAAVVIGLIAFGSFRLLNKDAKKTDTATIINPKAGDNSLPVARTTDNDPEPINTSTDISANDEDARNDAALEESKRTFAKLSITPKKKIDAVAGFNFAGEMEQDPEMYDENYLPAVSGKTSERYIVLMTPDGHFIRMSKKLSNLLCCVSGEEEDVKCRTQVDQWRKQIACSPTPHPGNFMDILSLLGSLQDN